jgi:hydrogen cyanide synthase HcnC
VSRSSDVVVVGGGVIGCAVAYYAAKRGLRVTLVDQPKRGRATSASAGGLWPLSESVGLGCGVILYKTALADGTASVAPGPAQLPHSCFEFAFHSNAMFPALAEELRETSGMDIELERASLLFLMYEDSDVAFGRSLWQHCPYGCNLIDWVTPEDLAKAEPALTREVRGALRFNGEGQVNPHRLADAFRAGARRLGATMVTYTEVTGLRVESGQITAVETTAGLFPCAVVVNAAGAWAGEVGRMAGLDIPVRPVRGQVVGLEVMPRVLSSYVSTTDCYLLQKAPGEVVPAGSARIATTAAPRPKRLHLPPRPHDLGPGRGRLRRGFLHPAAPDSPGGVSGMSSGASVPSWFRDLFSMGVQPLGR